MRKQLTVILIFAVFFLSAHQGYSQKIFLSPDGNDNNPGTTEKPLATLRRAADMAREIRKADGKQSVEIVALAGEYFMMQPLALTSADAGTADAPLIIRSEPGKKAVFRGGMIISNFEKVNDNLWKAFIPNVAYYDTYFEQLFVNGKRAVRARTPNSGFFSIRKVTETVMDKGTGRAPDLAVQKIEIDSSEAACFRSFSAQDFSDALITFYHKWDNTRKHISGYDRKSSAIYLAGSGMKPWNSLDTQTRWYADNFMGALDAPGEWFLNRDGYLYYIPEEGQVISNTTFVVPVIKEFISINGEQDGKKLAENIRFENLVFEMSAYHTPAGGNDPAQAAAPVSAVISLDYARNISFEGCEIAHTGTYAFWFRRACSNCTVQKCYMHDLGAGGIKIGETVIRQDKGDLTNNITVDNNIISDGGRIFPCAVGILLFNASDNNLTHNEISNLRYTGISAGWVWGYAYSPSKRNKIEFNHIHHLGWGELCDMGGVYTLGASEGTTVSGNRIHHVYSYDYGGWGLYTDEGSYGIVEENNLVYSCKNSGFHQHYGKENIIRNNIFAFNIRSQLQATRVEEHRSISFTNNIILYDKGTLLSSNWNKFNLLSDNNCYWDTRTKDVTFGKQSFSEWQKSGKDVHSVIADPLFINPKESDFHFKKLSVAKKIGFKPFDYTKAGVYGDQEWIRLAEFDPQLAKRFDEIVAEREAATAK
jgi:hypothetical protein